MAQAAGTAAALRRTSAEAGARAAAAVLASERAEAACEARRGACPAQVHKLGGEGERGKDGLQTVPLMPRTAHLPCLNLPLSPLACTPLPPLLSPGACGQARRGAPRCSSRTTGGRIGGRPPLLPTLLGCAGIIPARWCPACREAGVGDRGSLGVLHTLGNPQSALLCSALRPPMHPACARACRQWNLSCGNVTGALRLSPSSWLTSSSAPPPSPVRPTPSTPSSLPHSPTRFRRPSASLMHVRPPTLLPRKSKPSRGWLGAQHGQSQQGARTPQTPRRGI